VGGNEQSSDLNPADKAASSSRIRAILGERLKDYYGRLQHIPPSERIQALMTQLEQKMQEERPDAPGADRRASN
jgi:hypothetical protein